jgi:hypothetical protein
VVPIYSEAVLIIWLAVAVAGEAVVAGKCASAAAVRAVPVGWQTCSCSVLTARGAVLTARGAVLTARGAVLTARGAVLTAVNAAPFLLVLFL